MRQVTLDTCQAFILGNPKTKDNTSTDGKRLFLHGNCIAKRQDGQLWLSTAGWATATTKERLNGVLSFAGTHLRVYQKQRVWYIYDRLSDELDKKFPIGQGVWWAVPGVVV